MQCCQVLPTVVLMLRCERFLPLWSHFVVFLLELMSKAQSALQRTFNKLRAAHYITYVMKRTSNCFRRIVTSKHFI